MWSIDVVMIVLVGLILFLSRNLVFSYKLVGHTIDVLDLPGVQDTVLRKSTNKELIIQVAQYYLLLTRYVPIALLSMFSMLAVIYTQLSVGDTQEWLVMLGTLVVSGGITWLWTFNPAPDWLYEAHLLVLITRATLDLEVIVETLTSLETRLIELKDKSEEDVGKQMLQAQCAMLEELAIDISATIEDLEDQQATLCDDE